MRLGPAQLARDRIQLLKSRFYVHQYKTFGEQLEEQDGCVTAAAEQETEARAAVEAARAEVALLQTRLSETRGQVDQAAEAFRKASGEGATSHAKSKRDAYLGFADG